MMTADSRVAFQTTSTGTELRVHGQTSVRFGDSSIVLEVFTGMQTIYIFASLPAGYLADHSCQGFRYIS